MPPHYPTLVATLSVTLLVACPAPTPTVSTPIAVTVPVPEAHPPAPTPTAPLETTKTTTKILDAQFPSLSYVWTAAGAEVLAETNGGFRGVRVYALDAPEPHWLYVTDGASPPPPPTAAQPDADDIGPMELTLRVPRPPEAAAIDYPAWGWQLLGNLALDIYKTKTSFSAGEYYEFQGGTGARLPAVVFATDPQIPSAEAEGSAPTFLHVIALPADDFDALIRWNPRSFFALLGETVPFVTSDLERPSLMSDARTAERIEAAIAKEGSAYVAYLGGDITWNLEPGGQSVTVGIGRAVAKRLKNAVTTLFPKGRVFGVAGSDVGLRTIVNFVPAAKSGWNVADNSNARLQVMFDGPTAARLAAALESGVTFENPEMPGFRLEVR